MHQIIKLEIFGVVRAQLELTISMQLVEIRRELATDLLLRDKLLTIPTADLAIIDIVAKLRFAVRQGATPNVNNKFDAQRTSE